MASSSTNRGEPTTVPLRPILRNARHPESNSLLEPPRLKRVRPPNLPPPLPTPTFSASFPPASPFGVWPQCDVLAGPPRSPHVHFPPTPALASMRLTHSCTAYDRAPIIVDSSAALDLALPERGARVMSSLTTAAPLPGQYSWEQQQQRAIQRRSRTPIGSYFHPRAFEAQDGREPPLSHLPPERRVVVRPRRNSREHCHHQQLQQRRPVSAPATLADLSNVPDLTYSSYSSSSSSEPSDESDVRSDEDNIAIISDHSNFVFSPHPKALSFFPHSPISMSPLSPRSRTHNLPVTQPSSPAASHAASRASSPSLLSFDSTTAPSAQTSSPMRSKHPRRHPRTYSSGWAKRSNAAANDEEGIFADDGCLGGF